MITRLQLGVSRLEYLEPEVLGSFLDHSWVHFGEPGRVQAALPVRFFQVIRNYGFSYLIDSVRTRISTMNISSRNRKPNPADLYRQTNFSVFYYRKGECLPVPSKSIDFIFSEHFFEHLFLDEALALLEDCYRVLKPGGVIRTCVPDADLRTYEPPEPVGYPNRAMPYTHPAKHKSRWSVYSFSEALARTRFETHPLVYCTRDGKFIRNTPDGLDGIYSDCPEKQLIQDLSYIRRKPYSLIVDGIKRDFS